MGVEGARCLGASRVKRAWKPGFWNSSKVKTPGCLPAFPSHSLQQGYPFASRAKNTLLLHPGSQDPLPQPRMFEEKFFDTKEQLQKLKEDMLLFQQVPMVEIDGMKLVQTRAILHYIAKKCNLLGNNLKDRALIIMYAEGTMDLMELLIIHPFLKPEEQKQKLIEIGNKAKNRYFLAYEKVLRTHGQNFLVGNQISLADVQLIEAILMVEERRGGLPLTVLPLWQCLDYSYTLLLNPILLIYICKSFIVIISFVCRDNLFLLYMIYIIC
uniref:Glutathione S-transferase n=1 Tax=Monodelphis domestica TaxID=13616 RepID=A0A5F8GKU4_MONDO